MFAMVAYSGSEGINVVDADLPSVVDPQFPSLNSHFLFPADYKLLLAYCYGVSVTRLKLDTPHLRAMWLPQIRPIERAVAPPQRPVVADFTQNPFTLYKNEETKLLISNNLGAATEQETCFLWVGDGILNIPSGPVLTMRGTATINPSANLWGSGAITLDQTLPQGKYSVVGMEAIGANLCGARLIFPGYPFRPGVVAGVDDGKYAGRRFRNGYLGEFGQFWNTALPQLEVFSNTAGSVTWEVFLDLIYLGRTG